MAFFKVKEVFVISLDQKYILTVKGLTIHILAVYEFVTLGFLTFVNDKTQE